MRDIDEELDLDKINMENNYDLDDDANGPDEQQEGANNSGSRSPQDKKGSQTGAQ